MKRIFCFFLGHKWLWLRMNRMKHFGLVHLCVDAGLDLDCERCGYEWRDALPWVSQEITEIAIEHRRMLQRRMSKTDIHRILVGLKEQP